MSEEQDKTEPKQETKQEKDVSVPDKKETGSGPAKTKPGRARKPHGKHGASGWGLLGLVVLGLVVTLGWLGYREFNKTKQTFSDIQQSQLALTEQNREFEARQVKQMASLKEQQRELAGYIEVLRDKNQMLRKDWLLMEAEYLIQLSNYRLLFERDVNTAIAALESADVRLRDTGDPGIISVRKVIAESIQALKQVPQADLAGLSLSLSAINKNIEKMPLNTPDPASKKNEQQSQADQKSRQVGSWSELPAAIWSDLKNLVVIRDHEEPVQPLLSPEQRFFLIENLRLQIEQARLAMLSGQANVFQERLATAIGWIEEHFDKESAVTRATLETLRQVKSATIAPELPDITGTYEVLRKYRQAEGVKGHQETPPARKNQPSESTDTDKSGTGTN